MTKAVVLWKTKMTEGLQFNPKQLLSQNKQEYCFTKKISLGFANLRLIMPIIQHILEFIKKIENVICVILF